MRGKPMFIHFWLWSIVLGLLIMVTMTGLLANLVGHTTADPGELTVPVTILLMMAAAGTLSLATGTAWFAARRLANPLERLATTARRMARGDWDATAPSADRYREAAVLSATLNHMAGELRREEQRRRAFIAAIAHELRTPLTHLQGYARSLLDGMVTDPASMERHLAIIESEARHMGRLVGDLLDYEVLQAESVSLRAKPTDVGQLLNTAVENIRPAATRKGVTVTCSVPQPLPRISVDPDRLRQVMWNLLDNAVQHTSPGGRVWVDAVPVGDGLRVTVHDTGKGIPDHQVHRIWEPFFTGNPARSREHGGYGLGLALSRQIIERHGGNVEVASITGVGSSIGFLLPGRGVPGEKNR